MAKKIGLIGGGVLVALLGLLWLAFAVVPASAGQGTPIAVRTGVPQGTAVRPTPSGPNYGGTSTPIPGDPTVTVAPSVTIAPSATITPSVTITPSATITPTVTITPTEAVTSTLLAEETCWYCKCSLQVCLDGMVESDLTYVCDTSTGVFTYTVSVTLTSKSEPKSSTEP